MDLSRAHKYARDQGINPVLYWAVRAILQPLFLIYFRVRRVGRQHVPRRGAVLLVANHRSFSDSFFLGMGFRRSMHSMAKEELFANRLLGFILVRLGAFPVRRGAADEEAMETARILLEQGKVVSIFPEGTRVRPGPLGTPKRGAGRLALQTGAKVVPAAIFGTERIRRGWLVKPHRVKIRYGRPLTFPLVEDPTPALAGMVVERFWSCVELQWEWLGGCPPLRRVAVVGAGSWGTAVAVLLARAGIEVQLGCRTRTRAAELNRGRVNSRYLPQIQLPGGIDVRAVEDLDLADLDLLCLAVPASAMPVVAAELADRTDRPPLLVLSKGLVAPTGALPSEYARTQLGAQTVAVIGGPAHALEAVAGAAGPVIACDSPVLRKQIVAALHRAGLRCESSADRVGVEVAGIAKNVACLATATAATHGINLAGAAAGQVFAECATWGVKLGADPATFNGLAGVGDLVASVLAPRGRNRRAGELLGNGVAAGDVNGLLGQTAESIHTVPLLGTALASAGIEAPATSALADLVTGRLDVATWAARVERGAGPLKRAA